MKQLVSVLVPAFNAEKWIGCCIESALAQTWNQKEIIVIDDGSKDSTYSIARGFASKYVKVVTQENQGASAARNKALEMAQGDYIQWLDADDLLAPDKIELQIKNAAQGQDSRTLLSGAWGKFYYRVSRTKFSPDPLWMDLSPAEWLFRKLEGNYWMAIETWLVSRRLTELAGPWDTRLSLDDDGEYFSRVISHADVIRFIPESCCFVRRSTVGMSHNLSLTEKKLDSLLISLISNVQRLISLEDSPRTRKAGSLLLNRWSEYFYPDQTRRFEVLKNQVESLGGELSVPVVRSKYRPIQRVLGLKAAKKAQLLLPVLRSFTEKTIDLLFYSLNRNKKTAHLRWLKKIRYHPISMK